MDMSSTPEGTGMTEAQAAERLFARYQSEDQGTEGETPGQEPEAEDEEPKGEDPEGDEADADPDAEPDEQPEDDDAPQTFKVKVHGEEIDVPLDELLKGYSREQDYTRKAQALAEDRKSIDGERKTLADTRTEYANRLEALQKALEASVPKVDQSLRQSNPAEWSAQMAEAQERAAQAKAVEAERQRIEREQEAEEARERERTRAQEAERLKAAIPEWADATLAQTEQRKLFDYALNKAGLSEEEASNILDHRVIVTLRKAMLYDELKAKTPEVKAKVEQAKTARPGGKTPSSRVTEEKSARARLARDGSTDAAVALLMSRNRRA